MSKAGRRTLSARFGLALTASFVAVGCPQVASAHAVGLSRGTYVVGEREVVADVTLSQTDAAAFASADALANSVHVSSSGVPCGVRSAHFADAPPDGTSLRAVYGCPAQARVVDIDVAFLVDIPFGHRHVARAFSDSAGTVPIDDVLTRDHHALKVGAGSWLQARSGEQERGAKSAAVSTALMKATSFAKMGVEHIGSGRDHLLFLFALVLGCGGLRTLFTVITAFTLGHSISLASSALGVWAPSAALVEPLITASIAYVGIENLLARAAASRWRLTLLFGVLHGFGFAGALREIHLEHGEIPLVLASFNLGVELGQLAMLAAVVPIVRFLRKRAWFQHKAAPALDGAVAVLGLVWTIVRITEGAS